MTATLDARASTLPIKYFLAYYGKDSWRNLILRWNGQGTSWTVYQVGVEQPLYQGPGLQLDFTGEPNSQYFFRLETTVDGTAYSREIMTFTTPLSPPVGLRTTAVSDSAATLAWDGQDQVSYDLADVTDSYRLIGTTQASTFTLTGLAASTRQSIAVRSVLPAQYSRWSAPLTFFTNPPDSVNPGTYDFAPVSTYVWAAGRPGSSDPQWRPAQDEWYHGDGLTWNDSSGVQTTFFFFGAPNPFSVLRDAVVTKCEVYVARSTVGGDPAEVLSRLSLHQYPSKPDSEPLPAIASVDAGSLVRGQAEWIEVPADWGTQLIRGAFAVGVAWGGVPERYMVARNQDASVVPRTGSVRITVG